MIEITGNTLTISDLVDISENISEISLSREADHQIRASYDAMLRLAKKQEPLYGINTGFGSFSDKRISLHESVHLNRNLIFSHAVGTGDPLPIEIVRAAMAVRINALAKGLSGVNPKIINTLIEMLNKNVIPLIPSKGSLGSSGDLCMLAHLGLVLIKDEKNKENESGKAFFQNEVLSGKEAMHKAGINRIEFAHKDGLALINGATFSAAISALCTEEAEKLIRIASGALSLSLEALCGKSDAFIEDIHKARNSDGQISIAATIRRIIQDSTFINSRNQVQDAYSLRCAPQVHGAVWETGKFVYDLLSKEINAATDNPLYVNRDKFVSGGNFHGERVGMAADYLSIAIAELGAISERRVFRLLDENLNNDLPAMLVDASKNEGLNSGFMILQYTAAALALENQSLVSADSTKSLPSSANQEDHNANAYNAAIHLWKIIENTTKILSIEIVTASRGIELRKKMDSNKELGCGTKMLNDLICKVFPYHAGDEQWGLQLEPFYSLMMNNSKFKKDILSILI